MKKKKSFDDVWDGTQLPEFETYLFKLSDKRDVTNKSNSVCFSCFKINEK
jgi:hypothetical protein